MKFFSFLLFPYIFSLFMTFLNAGVELDYLNTLRTKTGMPAFSEHASLRVAAQNHSAYMQTNQISGHYENSGNTGYTGVKGSERAVYAGYLHYVISENVSYGTDASYKTSIDGLFSAIYHRFGFLSLEQDEIGIGVSNNKSFYTYDMGNSVLIDLCQNNNYTGGSYYTPCTDSSKKIESEKYNSISNGIKEASPELILWPPRNANDIPPAFYEEAPDPLPNDSVSGYPVSVEFNSGKFTTAPTVSSFTLMNANGTQLNDIVLMHKSNDPHDKFNYFQHTLFPEKRLEWGSKYDVELIYNYNNVQNTLNWCFETRTLQGVVDRFYRIENNTNISLKVLSGKTYGLYVVPADTNDILGSVGYSYTTEPIFNHIDSHTMSVKLTGDIGKYVSFTFGNGQKIKLTIASTDTAISPSNKKCLLDTDNDGVPDINDVFPNDATESIDTDGDGIGNNKDKDDDNDGISDVLEKANGLNPLYSADGEADFDKDGFSNSIEISVGSNIRSASSKPSWTPVVMGEIVTFVPYFSK